MGDSLDGTGEPTPETQNIPIVDYLSFTNFLRKIITILAPEEDGAPPAFIAALEDKTHQDYIRKFIFDFQVWALCIQKCSAKGNFIYKVNLRNIILMIVCYIVYYKLWVRKKFQDKYGVRGIAHYSLSAKSR